MRLIHDSGALTSDTFAQRYGVERGYQTRSSAWFEKSAAIAPRFKRLIFYDDGAVFHCSDITAPERLSDDPGVGRLTWNGFFVCRRAAR